MKTVNVELYLEAIKQYGMYNIEWLLLEECGGLIDCLAKWNQSKTIQTELIAKLVRLYIMVEIMACKYDRPAFNAELKRELTRLRESIDINN